MIKLSTNPNLDLKLRYRFVEGYVYSLKVYKINKLEAFEMWVIKRMLKNTSSSTNDEVLRWMDGDRELLLMHRAEKSSP